MQKNYFGELLQQLFGFRALDMSLNHYIRLIDEYLYKMYPKQLELFKAESERFKQEVCAVGTKFEIQYMRILSQVSDCEADKSLQERVHSAAEYFLEKLKPLQELVEGADVVTDNKELRKRLETAFEELTEAIRIKSALLDHVLKNGFYVQDFLRKRAILSMEENEPQKSKRRERNLKKDLSVNSDIGNVGLYQALVDWRREESARQGLPAYTVLQQKAIIGLSNHFPENERELLRIPCIGKKTVEKYGKVLLDIVMQYKE